MLRLTSGLARRLPKAASISLDNVRPLSSSSIMLKKAPSGGPTRKTKITFKVLREQTKAKKPGMTHLEFSDAVGALGFEKLGADLTELGLKELSYENLSASTSTVVKFEKTIQSRLKTLGSFKKHQHHELFQQPVSLVSDNTIKLSSEIIDKLNTTATKDNRICLVGPNGVGKSTLLTQTKALALSKYQDDVIVMHIDLGQNLVNGTSDYIFNSKLNLYQQPMLTKRWIYKLRQVNEGALKKLKLTRDISFQSNRVDYNLKKGVNTVYEFLLHDHDFGKFSPTSAFKFFVEELQAQSSTIPILFSIDNFNAITDFAETKYRHADFTTIHLSEFELGDFVLKVAGGELSFEKGAVLLAKTSDVGTHRSTLNVALGIEEYDPYAKKRYLDIDVANRLRAQGLIKPFEVKTWSKNETKELLKFYEQAGVLFVKEYNLKEANQTSQELLDEKAAVRAGKVEAHQFDPVKQFNKILNNQYTITGGNPAHLLKASAFIF